MHVELAGAGGLECGQHQRQVLRPAARHDGVDSHFLHGALDQVGRYDRDYLLRLTPRTLQHPPDTLWRRRDHGQAVCPAPLIYGLELVLEVGHLDAASSQRLVSVERGKLLRHSRVERAGAAAGPVIGQAVPELRDAGEALPIGSEPTLEAVSRHAAIHAYQGRYDLHAHLVGTPQVGVVERIGAFREGGVILGVDRQGDASVPKAEEHRGNQLAGRAGRLDESDVPVRQVHPVKGNGGAGGIRCSIALVAIRMLPATPQV